MPSRTELNLRARVVNINAALAAYKNDSVLEEAVINAEKTAAAASGTATVLAVSNAGTRSDVSSVD